MLLEKYQELILIRQYLLHLPMLKKFSWKEVPKYIFFQVAGAFAASLLLMWLFPKSELFRSNDSYC